MTLGFARLDAWMESCAGDIHKCTSGRVGAMAGPWLCWGCVNDQACLRWLDKTLEHLRSKPVSPGPASDLRQMSLSMGLSFLNCKLRKDSKLSCLTAPKFYNANPDPQYNIKIYIRKRLKIFSCVARMIF